MVRLFPTNPPTDWVSLLLNRSELMDVVLRHWPFRIYASTTADILLPDLNV